MIDYETFAKIKHHAEQDGLTIQQIAETLDVSWHTVAKWVDKPRFEQRKSSPQPSKLDPYKDYIQRLLEKHDYSAQQILQRLRNEGYEGGYSILKEYVRKVRPPRRAAFLTLAFAPGECAQVDWGKFGTIRVGSTRRRLSFFLMVLCYSRKMYLEFTVLETMEHFLACHQNAFEYFGGIPAAVMIDNLKSGVLRHILGQAPVLNPRYLDFANYCNFTVKPCAPRKGNEKGRVENGVGYVKKNLLRGLEITTFDALHPVARQWLEETANTRIHSETKERPIDRFEKECSALRPLPPIAYDCGIISTVRVSSRFRVTLDTNRYSVPALYAGALVTLKRYLDRLCIYADEKLVARHVRSYDRNQDFEHPDHPKELLEQRRKARDQRLYATFLGLTPRAEAYYRELQERRLNTLHHVRQIVALAEIYGKDVVARAIDDGFEFHAFSCEYIANIIEMRARKLPEPGALHLTRQHDLLNLEVPEPDLSIYEPNEGKSYVSTINKDPDCE